MYVICRRCFGGTARSRQKKKGWSGRSSVVSIRHVTNFNLCVMRWSGDVNSTLSVGNT